MSDYSARKFDQKVYDECDSKGKDLCEELCIQRGVKLFGKKEQYWEYGDALIDLREWGVASFLVGNQTVSLPSIAFIEVEIRGVQGQSPWEATGVTSHPSQFRFPTVSVLGRKAENSKAICQVSFDEDNATVVLMSTASRMMMEDTKTVRGDDMLSRVPIYLCLFLHRDVKGIWNMCSICNKSEENSPEVSILKNIFHFRSVN